MGFDRPEAGASVHQELSSGVRPEQEPGVAEERNQQTDATPDREEVVERDRICCFYDLSKSPPTHDFINWLCRIEAERQYGMAEKIDVVIVRGVRQRSYRDFFYSAEKRERRIWDLLVPLARLLPAVDKVFVVNPEDAAGFQQLLTYTNFTRPQAPVLRAPPIAREIVTKFINGRDNPVTINIRQSQFEELRNSNIAQWHEVSLWLTERGFSPIIVPDTEAVMEGDDNFLYLEGERYVPASFCPDLRLALYEQCMVNLFTTGGPMVMALHANVPFMAFKMIVPEIFCCTEEHTRNSCMAPDSNWGPLKKFYWKDDTFENIVGALTEQLPTYLEAYETTSKIRAARPS